MWRTVAVNLSVVAYVAGALAFRRRAVVIRVLTGVMLAWATYYFVAEAVLAPMHNHGFDFTQYLVGGEELRAGRDPYRDWREYAATGGGPVADVLGAHGLWKTPPISYLPPFYVAVMPLFRLPFETAFKVWTLLNAALLVGAVVFAARAFGVRTAWGTAAALALAFVWVPTYDNALQGQVNVLLLFALAVAAWGVAARRRLVAGAASTIGLLVKVYPGIVLLYFLFRRRWREVAAAAVVATAVVVVVGAVYGFGLYRSFVECIFIPTMQAPRTWILNTSPVTLAARLIPAGVDPAPFQRAWGLALLAACGAGLLYFIKPRFEPAAEIAAFVALSVTASVWTTQHHHVLLALPFLFLGRELYRGRLGRWPAAFAVASFLVIAWRVDLRDLQFLGWRGVALAALKPLALLALPAALLLHARRESAAAAAPQKP
jgi:hypothetical protein